MDKDKFDLLKTTAVEFAEIGWAWWKAGYPQIALEIMNTNIKMVHLLNPNPTEADRIYQNGLEEIRDRLVHDCVKGGKTLQ